jgi:ribonuclease HI
MSNNFAEYAAVCVVFREVEKLPATDFAMVRGDSMLVVMQLLGRWDVRGGLYMPAYREAIRLFDPLRARVTLEWIPREANSECDKLSKQVLLDRGIVFRIQPEARHLGAIER